MILDARRVALEALNINAEGMVELEVASENLKRAIQIANETPYKKLVYRKEKDNFPFFIIIALASFFFGALSGVRFHESRLFQWLKPPSLR